MSVFTYYAKNRDGLLVSGHDLGGQYQLEIGCIYLKKPAVRKTVNTSLGGQAEEILYHTKTYYDITTKGTITLADHDNWLEMFSSVAAREVFQFDPTGTIASPGTDINVVLVGNIPEPQMLDVEPLFQ